MSIFYITQKVSDPITDTKDLLPANTTNYFCSSARRRRSRGSTRLGVSGEPGALNPSQ
jgi:hypothetical protein